MSDIFLSHVAEDAMTALQIALGLETVGYTTWCYEIDSVPGPSYLLQTGEAIETSQAVLLLVSSAALASPHQINREVDRAHETQKPIIPILCDVDHEEFQRRAPEWRQAVGTATSIRVPAEGVDPLVSDLIRGLEALDVRATGTKTEDRITVIQQELRPRKHSRKTHLLLILPFVVTALVLVPLTLLRRGVTIEGNLTVNKVSFVLGSQVPEDVFSGVITKAFTVQGVEKVELGNGQLEAVATRDPQSGDPLTWHSFGQLQSALIVPADSTTASVTFYNATLNALHISSASHVTLLWLEADPRLFRLRFDDKVVAGRLSTPSNMQFSCTQCRITDSARQENTGAEWRFVNDHAQIVDFQGRSKHTTLGFELADNIPLSEKGLPVAEGLSFVRLRGTVLESTITSEETITIEETEQKVIIYPGDFVVFNQLQDFQVRSLSLNNGLKLSFHGKVGELRAGPAGAIQNHLPSLLIWLYHQQAWLLCFYTVVLIGTTIVAILDRFNVLGGGK